MWKDITAEIERGGNPAADLSQYQGELSANFEPRQAAKEPPVDSPGNLTEI